MKCIFAVHKQLSKVFLHIIIYKLKVLQCCVNDLLQLQNNKKSIENFVFSLKKINFDFVWSKN